MARLSLYRPKGMLMAQPPPLDYLFDCSRNSLQNFKLANLNKASERKKLIRKLFDELIEAEALSLLAEWFELHGEQLVLQGQLDSVADATQPGRAAPALSPSGPAPGGTRVEKIRKAG